MPGTLRLVLNSGPNRSPLYPATIIFEEPKRHPVRFRAYRSIAACRAAATAYAQPAGHTAHETRRAMAGSVIVDELGEGK